MNSEISRRSDHDKLDFRNYLVEDKNDEIVLDSELRLRIFNHFVFSNGYRLSIQASSLHYSSPRKTLDNIFLYTRWEMYKPRSLPTELAYLEEYPDDVISVETEKVQQIVEHYIKRFGLPQNMFQETNP